MKSGMQVMKKIRVFLTTKVPIFSLVSLVFLFIVFYTVYTLDSTNNEEQLKNLEDCIMKTAIHCYAIEGAYPDSLEYLEANYSLSINSKKYIVHYEIFASNIAPDITVITID